MEVIVSNFKICLRSGSFKLLLYMGAAAVALAVMVSAFSGRQPATLMVDFGFSAIRIVICLSSLLWIQELLAKPIESKTIVQSLSYPAARSKFVLSAYFSMVVLVAVAVVVFASALAILPSVLVSYKQDTPMTLGLPYVVMWSFLVMDIAVVLAFGVLIAVLSTTPFLAVVVAFGFYIAGHAVKEMLNLLSIAFYIDARETHQSVLGVIQYLIPDLSAFDVRHWSIYSESFSSADILSRVASAIAYLGVCLTLACLTFSRREIV